MVPWNLLDTQGDAVPSEEVLDEEQERAMRIHPLKRRSTKAYAACVVQMKAFCVMATVPGPTILGGYSGRFIPDLRKIP